MVRKGEERKISMSFVCAEEEEKHRLRCRNCFVSWFTPSDHTLTVASSALKPLILYLRLKPDKFGCYFSSL